MALNREESPLFAGTVAGTLRLLAYVALAMVLMVLDHRNGWTWRVRYATAVVVEPLYRLAGAPTAGVLVCVPCACCAQPTRGTFTTTAIDQSSAHEVALPITRNILLRHCGSFIGLGRRSS